MAEDMTHKFNTELPPAREDEFRAWVEDQSAKVKRDISRDLYDYDLRGWWAKNGSQDLSGAHLTDQYKKPNHPTFSEESKYSGQNGFVGGSWGRDPATGKDTFQPGPTNKQMWGGGDLQNYFQRAEPDVILLDSAK